MDRQPADPAFPETSVPLDGTGFGAGGLTPSGRFSAEVGDGRRPSWQRYGGNARVIPGKNEQTGEEVAIKLVAKVHPYHRHRNDIVAANRVAEVRREAEIGCAVPPHPNVIRYYAAEENEFWFFLIMEMGVVELFDLVTDGGAQTQYEESTRVAAQLVEGLAHLHAHGVVHLDLKLDNCVRGRDDQWKWVDLGAASQGRMQRKVTGTGFYMAPELGPAYSVAATFDGFAADCFSLGVSIYLLLTSNFPFMEHQQRGSDARSHCALRAQQAGKSTSVALLTQLRMGAPAWPQSLLHLVDGFLLFDPSKRLGLSDAKKLLRGEKPSLINRIFHFRSAGDDDDEEEEEEEGEVPPPIAAKRCRAKTAKPHAEWADAAAEEAADGEAKPEEAVSAPAGEAKAE